MTAGLTAAPQWGVALVSAFLHRLLTPGGVSDCRCTCVLPEVRRDGCPELERIVQGQLGRNTPWGETIPAEIAVVGGIAAFALVVIGVFVGLSCARYLNFGERRERAWGLPKPSSPLRAEVAAPSSPPRSEPITAARLRSLRDADAGHR